MSKKLVVIGGAGALGRGIVSTFAKASWKPFSVDFALNEECDCFMLDNTEPNTLKQAHHVMDHLNSTYGTVDAVVCAAGGWAGGSIKDAGSIANFTDMMQKNTESAMLAAHLSTNMLNSNGLMVLMGATAALNATPGMVSYGISKTATHYLIASTIQELPEDSTALGILPTTIDTPMNRKAMSNADFSSWTKIDSIANKIQELADTPSSKRPPSGHLLQVDTKDNQDIWTDIGNPFN